MEVQECIRTRRSIRKYTDQPVDWEKIVQILDAGKMAPSAGNIQNWKFIVVRDDGTKEKLAKAAFEQDWMEEAHVHIVVVGQPDKAERFYGARGERLYTIQGCAAVVENMLLVANDIGLGACWVGAFDEAKVKRVLNIPDGVTPQAIITIGYADEKPDMPPRVALEHVAYLERWAGKGVDWRAKGYKSVVIQETIEDAKKALKRVGRKLAK